MLNYFRIGFFFTILQLPVYAERIESGGAAQLYVHNFKEDAIKEMLLYNIPASIILAQGMLESGNGTSDLAVLANNHFGIKCHDEWEGPTFIKSDDAKDECFRKYPTVLDSYTDHSLFLKSRARYSKLFELNRTDYKAWAKGLKEAGYATDPEYSQRLLDLIETHELFKFDLADHSSKNAKSDLTKKHSKNIKSETTKKSHSAPPIAAVEKEVIVAIENEQPHEILRLGIVKYIIIKPNDTFDKIAKETDKDLWQLYKFNDLSQYDKLVPGQKLYLQPKLRKAKESFHIVKMGETMKSISQFYGIKLKYLYKKNNMREWEEPITGQLLYMRDMKK
ncbi:MAG: glucosaminidase domain-containing protein [Bacteroidetes bacterium]|nr:glucosaminidase domain-containing protein [Bacteroidota bacterium]